MNWKVGQEARIGLSGTLVFKDKDGNVVKEVGMMSQSLLEDYPEEQRAALVAQLIHGDVTVAVDPQQLIHPPTKE
jgi:hypothetical protein